MTNGIKVKVVKDSIHKGNRLTTLQLRYHRYIHGEFMTHRVFSRNASSSRAIPVKTMLKQVWNDPAIPVHWGANQPGMQARKHLEDFKLWAAQAAWIFAARLMCIIAWIMIQIGLHKQIANRILEPWQFIHVIVTATDWDNFFLLRDHPDAQPEIRVLAAEIRYWMGHSTPQELQVGEYHLPYISDEDFQLNSLADCIKMSVARCARVSYLTHDGKKPSKEKDIKLHDDLVVAEPIHASPSEHQATPAREDGYYKNFNGWVQYRSFVEAGHPA
jgi:hypothetical protein